MGANMAERLLRDGHEVVAYDLSEDAVAEAAEKGATGVTSLEELAGALEAPRVVWVMVPAGDAVDQTIENLLPHLAEGRHDRRRRQLELPRQPAPRRVGREATASTSSTSAPAAASGGWTRATA